MLIWGIGNYCFTHINLGLILRNPIPKKNNNEFLMFNSTRFPFLGSTMWEMVLMWYL